MVEQKESKASEWAKLLVPVLLPMLIMGCLFLTNIVLSQNNNISELQSLIDSQSNVIATHERGFYDIKEDAQQIRVDITKLESRITVAEQNQGKVIDIIGDLNKTLERINVTVGKLETRLDYAEKRGS